MSRTLCAYFSSQSLIVQFDNNDDCNEKNSLYKNKGTGSSSIQSSQASLDDLPTQKIDKELDRYIIRQNDAKRAVAMSTQKSLASK